jgi:prepilin-type N-terminal cleavage/methylation domain-containing protein
MEVSLKQGLALLGSGFSPTLETNQMQSSRMRGFSLLEMMIVISIALIVVAVTFVSLQPVLRQNRVANAYNITLGTLRNARETAIADRRVYIVSLSNAAVPNTLTVTQANTGAVVSTLALPLDTSFVTQAGFPAIGPDGFGTGVAAVDFDQNVAGASAADKTSLYFYPDGSVQDINNGVVYVGRTNDPSTPRAITMWGATGRMRGWRLYPNGASKYWGQI